MTLKTIVIATSALLLAGCSQEKLEEMVFTNVMESQLIELCGSEDKICINAVKTQLKPCMEKANWRRYLNDDENPQELERFTTEFYACVVDKDGQPFFEFAPE